MSWWQNEVHYFICCDNQWLTSFIVTGMNPFLFMSSLIEKISQVTKMDLASGLYSAKYEGLMMHSV